MEAIATTDRSERWRVAKPIGEVARYILKAT